MLDESQIKGIKEQILKQIDNFPEEQREDAKEKIENMNAEELEQFLVQNKLIKPEGEKDECIFCSIINGKIPVYRIDDNKTSLAILDINPLSHGHTLVISKEHKKLPSQALTLANKIANKIKLKLKPEEVKIESSSVLGHQIINIIPIYNGKKLEKKKATEKELFELQKILEIKHREKVERVKKVKVVKSGEKSRLPQAPRRIP